MTTEDEVRIEDTLSIADQAEINDNTFTGIDITKSLTDKDVKLSAAAALAANESKEDKEDLTEVKGEFFSR